MNALILLGTAAMLGGMLLLSVTFSDGRTSNHPCLSQEDILWYQDRSRNGVSLTCTPEIRMQNLRRQVSQ